MPVYNAERYLEAAVNSIRTQTCTRWELILVDDASQDRSAAMMAEWAQRDARIITVKNRQNLGLGGAMDAGIRVARGAFLARMDADDVSHPTRLAEQVAFLQAHPEVVVVGCQTRLIDTAGRPVGGKTFPTDHEALYRMMFVTVPMQHPTIMINRQLLPADFTWYEGWPHAEDTLLFFKLTRFGRLANLDQVLFDYRYYSGSTSLRNAKKTFQYTYQARRRACRELGYRPTLTHRVINRLQWLAVTCLPNWLLPGAFAVVRKLMVRAI
jgi:glycosyltransferase involved in cell wall biosynthesis